MEIIFSYWDCLFLRQSPERLDLTHSVAQALSEDVVLGLQAGASMPGVEVVHGVIM